MQFFISMFGTAILLILLFKGLALLSKRLGKSTDIINYQSKPSLLTPPELYAFKTLSAIIPETHYICPKPRIADFLTPAKQNRQTGFNKISQKHVDFLIIESCSSRPILAIEIDDSSHNRKDRQERDLFINEALATARIPIVRFGANQQIQLGAIEHHLNAA